MKYTVDIAKILTRQKQPGHFLTTYIYKPQVTLGAGNIYFVIEILNINSLIANEISQMIINTVIREYYKNLENLNGDVLFAFEMALRKINEKLGGLTEEGQISWIGNLNAIIAILQEKNIHITKAGTTELHLIRNGKINHITSGLSSTEKPHPLKTFAQIISGTLEIGDKLVISTAGLFNYLSLDRIKITIASKDVREAAESLLKILQREKAEPLNCLILEFTTEEELSNKPFSREPEEFYLDEVLTWQQKINFYCKPYIYKIKILLQKFIKNVKIVYHDKVKPNLIRFKNKLERFFKPFLSKSVDKIKPALKKVYLKIKYSRLFTQLQRKISSIKISSPSFEKTSQIKSLSKQSYSKITLNLQEIKKPENKQKIIFALAILSTAILFFSVTTLYAKKQTVLKIENSKKLLQQAYEKENAGKNALIIHDKKLAKQLFTESLQIAESIKENKYVKEEANALITKLYTEIDKVDGIVRINNPLPIVDFSTLQAAPQGLIKFDKYLYTFDNQKGIIKFSLKDKSLKILNKTTFKGTFVDAAVLNKYNLIVFTTSSADKQRVYEFDPAKNQLSEVKIIYGEEWVKASSIKTYEHNIYLLDPVNGAVMKYIKSLAGYQPGFNITPGVDLVKSTYLAIDGYIYVLKKDGSIAKLLQQTSLPFTISGIPKPQNKISNPTKIFTLPENNYLYVLDKNNQRIVALQKDGTYYQQYISDSFDNLIDFYIPGTNDKIYVLNDAKVFVVNL